jgi:hypothetical protein
MEWRSRFSNARRSSAQCYTFSLNVYFPWWIHHVFLGLSFSVSVNCDASFLQCMFVG